MFSNSDIDYDMHISYFMAITRIRIFIRTVCCETQKLVHASIAFAWHSYWCCYIMSTTEDCSPVAPNVHAVAGVASCCYMNSLDIAFDMGICFGKAASQSHVFITHGHLDHIQAIPAHAGQRSLLKMKPATYYVPQHLVHDVEKIIQSFAQMQEVRESYPIIHMHVRRQSHLYDDNSIMKNATTCLIVDTYRRIPYLRRLLG